MTRFVEYGRIDNTSAQPTKERSSISSLITGLWKGILTITMASFLWLVSFWHCDEDASPTELPTPDFSNYDPKEYQDLTDVQTRKKLLTFLDLAIPDCGFTATANALEALDPRIHLCVAGKEYDMNVKSGDITIPVVVKDTPGADTSIIKVDSYENDLAEFEYI